MISFWRISITHVIFVFCICLQYTMLPIIYLCPLFQCPITRNKFKSENKRKTSKCNRCGIPQYISEKFGVYNSSYISRFTLKNSIKQNHGKGLNLSHRLLWYTIGTTAITQYPNINLSTYHNYSQNHDVFSVPPKYPWYAKMCGMTNSEHKKKKAYSFHC